MLPLTRGQEHKESGGSALPRKNWREVCIGNSTEGEGRHRAVWEVWVRSNEWGNHTGLLQLGAGGDASSGEGEQTTAAHATGGIARGRALRATPIWPGALARGRVPSNPVKEGHISFSPSSQKGP